MNLDWWKLTFEGSTISGRRPFYPLFPPLALDEDHPFGYRKLALYRKKHAKRNLLRRNTLETQPSISECSPRLVLSRIL